MILADLRGVDVDVDHLRPAGELRHLAGHPIVEPHAQRQQQVAVVHRVVGIDAAVHAEHVQRERIVAGEASQPHQGHGHGNARLSHQRGQFLAGVGGDHAAAGVDHRALGGADHRRGRRDLRRRGDAAVEAIARQLQRGVVVRHGLHVLHVLGNVDQHRAGPAGRGHVERLAHDPGDVADVGHQVMVLGDAAADLDDRRLLKGVGADDRRAHLAGDGQQRHAVELGVGDGGHEVRGPRPAGGHADADLAGRAGVALGGKSAALLVPRQDHADLVAEPRQGLVQGNARPAGIGENRVHPVVHEALHDDIRPAGRLRIGRLQRAWKSVCWSRSPQEYLPSIDSVQDRLTQSRDRRSRP